MRSDHLKSHMKKHVDLSSEDPEQICKSILEDVINDIHNKDETSMYRKKPKINDLNSNGLDELHKSLTAGVDKMEVRNTILYDTHEHKMKLELGETVHEIIRNDEVDLNSLRPEYKEALDLYLKKSVESFPVNIEFKPPPLVYAMANCHGHRHGILPWPWSWTTTPMTSLCYDKLPWP